MQAADHWDGATSRASFRRAADFRSDDVLHHGAYLCIQRVAHGVALDATSMSELASRYQLTNEYNAEQGHPPEAIGLLKKGSVQPGDLIDNALLAADAVVHVGSASAATIRGFCGELTRLLRPSCRVQIVSGVVRPTRYTGTLMHNFAYAHQVLQHPASVMPNAFLLPMNKTRAWWDKDWMERHSYFLPRYDDQGRLQNEGHVLVTERGIACIMRRTYRNVREPAPEGEYDFLNYFECADDDVPVFHDVCAGLRDVARNPEWRYVDEGPLWHGRRVETWAELIDR